MDKTICECCKLDVPKKDEVRIKTYGFGGSTVMHKPCFDQVWQFWSERENIIKLINEAKDYIEANAVVPDDEEYLKNQLIEELENNINEL